MVMFSKNWLSSLFSMIENGSVVVTHARAASLSAKLRMRNVRDYYPPKDYHCVATASVTTHRKFKCPGYVLLFDATTVAKETQIYNFVIFQKI